MIRDIFLKFKKVVTVEGAYGDEYKPPPLAMLLRSQTLVDVRPMISQATGRPIRPRIIMEKVKELIT